MLVVLTMYGSERAYEDYNVLYEAVKWHHEIRDMFSYLGIPETEVEKYTEDYVTRLYMLKIKNVVIYSSPFAFL